MWADKVRRLRFKPQDGLEVVASGNIDVYAAQGRYQLYIERLQPVGVGALELAFRQLYEKLLKEGLFDPARKRPLPRYPSTVAIVTSPTGAAIRDIVRTILRRWPAVRLIVVPVRVQGEEAAEEIARAIGRVNEARLGIEVMIVGRGGGSIEDLWAFNEEVLARAIHASRIPVISAVGHERDTTIADLVADARAATPTHAGEMVVRVMAEVLAELDDQADQLNRQIADKLAWHRLRLEGLEKERCIADPTGRLRQTWQGLDKTAWQAQSHLQRLLTGQSSRLGEIRLRMQQVHPNVQMARTRARLEEAAGRLQRAGSGYVRLKAAALDSTAACLRQLSPLRPIEALEQRLAASVSCMQPGARARPAGGGQGPERPAGPPGGLQPPPGPQAWVHDHPQRRDRGAGHGGRAGSPRADHPDRDRRRPVRQHCFTGRKDAAATAQAPGRGHDAACRCRSIRRPIIADGFDGVSDYRTRAGAGNLGPAASSFYNAHPMTDALNNQTPTYSLEDFLDAATLQEIQGAFTAGTGLRVCFYDRSGKRVTEPADSASFCTRGSDAANDDLLGKMVAAACGQSPAGPLELSCDGRHCHTAIPIRSDQQILGMLVLGANMVDSLAAQAGAAVERLGLPGVSPDDHKPAAGLAEPAGEPAGAAVLSGPAVCGCGSRSSGRSTGSRGCWPARLICSRCSTRWCVGSGR